MEKLIEAMKKAVDSYGCGYFGEDDLPEGFKLIEKDDWTQDHKYQYMCLIVQDPEGNYFQIQNSRTGSYYDDWCYGEPYISQVKRVEKVVTTVVWEPVK